MRLVAEVKIWILGSYYSKNSGYFVFWVVVGNKLKKGVKLKVSSGVLVIIFFFFTVLYELVLNGVLKWNFLVESWKFKFWVVHIVKIVGLLFVGLQHRIN